MKQSIVTLDMEGVLTPEIWIAVAEKTGIPELRRTTRDASIVWRQGISR
jgi:phosphoserine/homoserine phosphotransferase